MPRCWSKEAIYEILRVHLCFVYWSPRLTHNSLVVDLTPIQTFSPNVVSVNLFPF